MRSFYISTLSKNVGHGHSSRTATAYRIHSGPPSIAIVFNKLIRESIVLALYDVVSCLEVIHYIRLYFVQPTDNART